MDTRSIELELKLQEEKVFNAPTINLDNVIISAQEDETPLAQTERIVTQYNKGLDHKKSCFVVSPIRGKQIDPGTFVLGIRNNQPELHGPSTVPIARRLMFYIGQYTKIQKRDIQQSDRFYGANGAFVLNVPIGSYALAHSGNIPKIYGQGCHVIHDPNFKFDEKTGIISQASSTIEHGTIHILRVPIGKLAKIWIGSDPYILMGRSEPYVFNQPLFRLVKPNADDANKPKVDDGFFDQADSYISHGTTHILRVPAGKIAKVWIGPQALLLESRVEPYQYTNPQFHLERKDKDHLFFDATSELIIHGQKKRVIPHTGQVAVTYNNGKLEVLEPKTDGTPHLIDSSTHEVNSFISTGVETLIFPSEETKRQRQKDDAKMSSEEVMYDVFTTRDSLKIGVKLLVAFRIEDPIKALTSLINYEGILKHIENVATVDMGKAIQKCSSQEFLNFYQTKVTATTDKDPMQMTGTYQDEVKKQLTKDLKDYGIELVRLNIETPKVLDRKVADQMAEVSMQSATSNAKESTMEQKYRIAQREAQQDAETKRIAQEQINAATQSKAQAELAAVQAKVQGQLAQAEADKKTKMMAAEAEAFSIRTKGEAEKAAMDLKGEALGHSPQLLELEIARVKAKVLAKASLNLTSQDLAAFFNRSGLTLFAPTLSSAPKPVVTLESDNAPAPTFSARN